MIMNNEKSLMNSRLSVFKSGIILHHSSEISIVSTSRNSVCFPSVASLVGHRLMMKLFSGCRQT